MANKCYYKPNRTTVRKFTARDVARIATYAVADGVDALFLIKEVISALGLAGRFCSLAILAASAIKLRSILVEAGAVWGLKKFLALLLRLLGVLKSPYVRWIARLNVAAVLIIAAIVYLEDTIKVVSDLVDNFPSITDAAELAGALCNEAQEILTG